MFTAHSDLIEVLRVLLAPSLLLVLVFRTGLGFGDWLLVWTSSASAATRQLDDAFQTLPLVNL